MAPCISAQEITKSYSDSPLFQSLSLAVHEGERLAILGRNGSGKSTLLKILARLEEPDSGSVAWRTGLHVQYVPQQDSFSKDTAVQELESALSEDDFDRTRKAEELLSRLGFADGDHFIVNMSGGEKKRLAIARALISSPDVLLLDEPTNHLDIQGVVWLEDLIQNSSCTTVFISHDRYFIENLAERVVEIDERYVSGTLAVKGGYSDFLETRENFLAQLEQYRASLANRVRREVEWLRQGAKARTTKAKGRSNEAHRMIAELAGIKTENTKASFEFAVSDRKTRELIVLEKVGKRFGERTLFKDISLTLGPGSRLGVVGTNGSGKSTFLKVLTQEIPPDTGRVQHARNVRVVLLDQMRKALDESIPLKKLLAPDGDSVVFQGEQIHLNGWGKRFLFSPEQLSQPVGKLSGGERARALIARLVVEPADVLVLDEPTNDLDISTLEVLEESLTSFPGAVVLVTHDRYLLDRVCSQVLGLSTGDKGTFFADYRQWEEFLRKKESEARLRPPSPAELRNSEVQKSAGEDKQGKIALTREERKELGSIEQRISRSESLLQEFTQKLELLQATDPSFQTLCTEIASQQEKIDALYLRWEELEKKNGV